jgi:hypothetical protein
MRMGPTTQRTMKMDGRYVNNPSIEYGKLEKMTLLFIPFFVFIPLPAYIQILFHHFIVHLSIRKNKKVHHSIIVATIENFFSINLRKAIFPRQFHFNLNPHLIDVPL